MRTYATTNEYIQQVVNPSLGEYVDNFDVKEIAAEMTTYYDGNGNLNEAGLIEREDKDFWDVAAKYDSKA